MKEMRVRIEFFEQILGTGCHGGKVNDRLSQKCGRQADSV